MLGLLFTFGALLLATPALVLATECLLALLPLRAPTKGPRPRLAVLVPAHDEEAMIGGTVDGLKRALRPGDRLVVVADNCSDRTAEVARARGAEVASRVDPTRVGKGHALAFGARFLAADPPEVVVVVDADCQLGAGALDALARAARATGRPVQGEYLLEPSSSSSLASVSALAFLVRNLVRPRGLARLGGPCQLTGSGMAFPFPLLAAADTLGSNIVEDLELGIELTYRGHPPLLCPEARILGELPEGAATALGQRRRWEHGHLGALLRHGPKLLARGFTSRDAAALLLGLDLLVPPLSLLLVLELMGFAAAVLVAMTLGYAAPLTILTMALGLAGVSVLLAWARFGRASIPARHLLAAPLYVAWKVPIYVAFLCRRAETRWVRTRRNGARG